jgi:hypothetical protein
MPSAAIDACCLIDLLASGVAEAILSASGFRFHLPTAVRHEVQYARQHDPAHPGKVITAVVDLSGPISSGLLTICEPENALERESFVRYAAQFRSDGEAMCLALALARAWVVATDDRKAIRIAREAGLTVASCPEIVREWANATNPDPVTLRRVLEDIHVLAQFRPNPSMPEYQWWVDEIARACP